MDKEDIKSLLSVACNFQANSSQARKICHEAYIKAEREEDNTLRILVDGQIASLVAKLATPISAITPELSYQIGLSASYIRTHFVITNHIMDGDLVEAMTLIRKQLESLARLNELDSKPLSKLEGRTPNISALFTNGGGGIYGSLSEVAHFSKPRVSELLHVLQDGDRIGPSLQPVFTEYSFACLDMHHFIAIYFLGWITLKSAEWYPDLSHEKAYELLYFTMKFAIDAGIIRFSGDVEI